MENKHVVLHIIVMEHADSKLIKEKTRRLERLGHTSTHAVP
jgi:hypothetical protein